jgi:hypothetical protein
LKSKKRRCCLNNSTHFVTFNLGTAGLFQVKLCDDHYGKEPYDEYIISDKIIGDLLE